MVLRHPAAVLLVAGLGILGGCTGLLQTTPVPADLSPGTAAGAARLTEDGDHPLILRGVDGRLVPFRVYMPALIEHHYLLTPGKHRLWVQSLADFLYPLPIPLGDIHCYVLEADLAAGKTYRMKEQLSQGEALLLEGDGPENVIARGSLVDRFMAGTRTCKWP